MNGGQAPDGGKYNVLFLCTGNSARSILAEALLRHYGGKRFNAYSAGSHPTGRINPFVLEFLAAQRLPTEGLRSKSWDEFARLNAPPLHFVFTVCDNAAGEVCPVWPGQPLTAHWSVEDPARYMDDPDKARQAVRDAFRLLSRRISLFVSLPLEKLDRLALQQRIEEIGRTG
jgi:arsenate reductase